MRPYKYNPNNHSGLFRNRISILQMVSGEDELGNQTGLEERLFTQAWAMIKTVKGSEYLSAAAVRGERIYRFIIHYAPGITNDMTIAYEGRKFDIIEPPINDDEMDSTLTIIARERI